MVLVPRLYQFEVFSFVAMVRERALCADSLTHVSRGFWEEFPGGIYQQVVRSSGGGLLILMFILWVPRCYPYALRSNPTVGQGVSWAGLFNAVHQLPSSTKQGRGYE